MEFKVLVDTLSSLASLIAIITVMVGWYRSTRKPLKVMRVVVHKTPGETTFIIVVKNVKGYPVSIKRTECYRRKKYVVQKRRGGRPEYSEFFPGSEMIFTRKEEFEIPANAHTDIRVTLAGAPNVPSKVLFLLETSHGYHALWCRDVVVVEIGKVDVYSVEYKHDYGSKLKAKARYYLEIIKG